MKIKGTFYEKVMKLFSGTVASQVLWIIAMIVVSKLYSAEELGEQQLFVAASSVFSIIGTGRYEMAISIPKFKFKADQLCIFSSLLSITYAIVLFILLFSMASIFPYFSQKYMGYSLIVIPIYVLEVCLYLIFYNYLLREQCYRVVVKGLMIYPSLYIIFAVICRYVDVVNSGLIIAIIIARGGECLYYGAYLRNKLNIIFSKKTMFMIINIGKEYVDFPRYMLLGDIIDSLKSNSVPFFITTFWGKTTTGYYSMATQCLAAPSSLIAKSVGDVFRQEGSKLYILKDNCESFYKKNLRLCTIYSSLICIIVFFLAPIIVNSILGIKWEETWHYIHCMLLMLFSSLISSPLSNMYTISRKQKEYMIVQILFLFGSIISFLGGGFYGASIECTLLIWGICSFFISCFSVYGGLKISRQ